MYFTYSMPMCDSLLMLLILLLPPSPLCNCIIFQIDSSYPFISVSGLAVDWHSGAATQWALSSLLVRIHPRGVVFKKQGWHTRDLPSIGWQSENCHPSAHGLCQTGGKSVFFPSSQLPEVNEAFTEKCATTATNRVITNPDTTPALVMCSTGAWIMCMQEGS